MKMTLNTRLRVAPSTTGACAAAAAMIWDLVMLRPAPGIGKGEGEKGLKEAATSLEGQ